MYTQPAVSATALLASQPFAAHSGLGNAVSQPDALCRVPTGHSPEFCSMTSIPYPESVSTKNAPLFGNAHAMCWFWHISMYTAW